jgi:hypothetical protein
MAQIRQRLTFANVVSVVAVFLALAGGAYAISTAPKNSVTSKAIKNGQVKAKDLGKNAVNASKVKDGSLVGQDFAAGQLPTGATGPQGATGVQGPDGEAAAFARLQADGTLLPLLDTTRPAEDKIVDQSMITHTADSGIYCFDLPFAPSSAMVGLDNAGGASAAGTPFVVSVAIERGNNINPCTPGDARVLTTKVSGTTAANTPELADHAFFIWFEK